LHSISQTGREADIRRIIYLALAIIILQGCKSVFVQDIKTSEAVIALNEPLIAANDAIINGVMKEGKPAEDIRIRIRLSTLNRLLRDFCLSSTKDVLVRFLKSEKIAGDERSFLGLKIENSVNLDTGSVEVDLNTVEVAGRDSVLSLRAVMEGRGEIELSAKFLGIGLGAEPEMELRLDERIDFRLVTDRDMGLLLVPAPKKIYLKTRFLVDFLAWHIPWSEDIELETGDIIQPIAIPLSDYTTIALPLSAGDGKGGQAPAAYKLALKGLNVKSKGDILTISSNIIFVRK